MDRVQSLLGSLTRWYHARRSLRGQQYLAEAAERHARMGTLPRHEFRHQGGRLDKVRFLRREHLFLDWTSWHSAMRED